MNIKHRVVTGSLPGSADRSPGEVIYVDDGSGILQQYVIGNGEGDPAYPVYRPHLLAIVNYKEPPGKLTSLSANTPTLIPYNELEFNSIPQLELTDNKISLPAGTYKVRAWANSYGTNRIVGAIVKNGANVKVAQGYSSNYAESLVDMTTVITTSVACEIWMTIEVYSAAANYGFGVNDQMTQITDDRTYAEMIIDRI